MAMETTMVHAEVVEAQEFPHLSQLHRVQAVPKTIINGVAEVLGAVSEATLLERILSTIGQEDLLEGHAAARPEEAPVGPTSAVGS
ncbi:MAG: thioredoxin family protein [Chloroflexi bacterium]|nr:thioredoxin family protein [Chloroflexota bacterium]